MRLNEALAALSPTDRGEVEAKVRALSEHSALGLQAITNLHSETRLPHVWPDVLETLRTCASDPVAIQTAVTQCFRRWALRGPALPRPHPALYGRAISRDRLSSLLVKLGYYASKQTARRAVRNLVSKERAVLVERWRSRKLGRYHMWAIFSSTPGSGGPFHEMPDSADEIRGLLGLDRSERGQPLVLMEYSLPEEAPPHFPTVADAYSGVGWSYFFRPAPSEIPHGLTMPWPEYETHELGPRPEAVHAVIRGDRLSSSLKEVL